MTLDELNSARAIVAEKGDETIFVNMAMYSETGKNENP